MKKKKLKNPGIVVVAIVLAAVLITTYVIAGASGVTVITNTAENESIHEKIDISDITGEIAEPPELTSAASSVAAEKAWYEYVYYSSVPVGYYYLTDSTRISFYDPYEYADALVMEVDDSLTDWSSNNSLQVSYETGNSLSATTGKSYDSSTSVQVVSGVDTSVSSGGGSTVTAITSGNTQSYNKSKQEDSSSHSKDSSWNKSSTTKLEEKLKTGSGGIVGKIIDVSSTTTIGEDIMVSWQDGSSDVTTEHGDAEDNGMTTDSSISLTTETTGDTVVTSVIADRITKATGSSESSSITMSTSNSTTVSKTYDAAHFSASGVPFQWKIIKYTVRMPMKYQIEYFVDGEWIFGDYSYCLLTTIQGTCRAWLQNNVAYYEHWGTGEAVTWDEFWSQFFTEESLIAAYKNRLYPNR